jgi:hypothetical protein
VAVAICFVFRDLILKKIGRLFEVLPVGNKAWISFWLIFGLAIRIAWIFRFPVGLKSDNFAYFQIAASWAQGHTDTGAFWPPGFSLFLTPWFRIFGAHLWVTEVCALIFFTATYFLTYALADRIQGGLASRIAPMLVAIWPGYLTLAGINCKESFLAVLVPATIFFYLQALDRPAVFNFSHPPASSEPVSNHSRFRWGFLLLSGLCMGFASLTQPGYMLFPAVIFGAEILRSKHLFRAVGRTIIFSIALIAVILPWTYRNYLFFHRMVLISTNGGSVFYRANNPLANANFSEGGEISLPKDEFAADRMGYKMADEWIAHHPVDFGVLMVRKQVVFLGDDALGAYETLKRESNPSDILYASLKAISNLFWLAAWTLVLLGFPLLFGLSSWRLSYGILFLPFLYQWCIDSVFESGPRHHVPYLSLIAVLVSVVLSLAVSKEKSISHTPR